MQRRHFLGGGVLIAAGLALVGGGVAWRNGPGWRDGRLTELARTTLRPIGDALLDGLLPIDASARRTDLDDWLDALQTTVYALPTTTQREFSDVVALLAHPIGRQGLAGLPTPWPAADRRQVEQALTTLRESRFSVPQQIYHALRDLAAAAYAADMRHWAPMRYPGPRPT